VAVMKNAVNSANNAVETVQRAVRQATEVAQSNFHAMSDNALAATKATAPAAPAARKR